MLEETHSSTEPKRTMKNRYSGTDKHDGEEPFQNGEVVEPLF